MIGQTYGQYVITGLIGSGGMGKVYRAADTTLQRDVAIKVLSSQVVGDPNVLERFRTEAKTLARLSHPNIASVFNLIESQGEYLLVMELVVGETLEERVQKDGPLTPQEASELICQALQGLEHAHSKGIVHRDIKPSNLMVTEEGVVKLMDFGIAKAAEGPKLTREGKAPGTPEYMSPEQIQGLPLDQRSDLYSMGVVLFELLSGDVPFHGDTDFELMRAHVDIQPPPLKLGTTAGAELDRIIQKSLSKNMNRRYANAGEMRADLQKVADSTRDVGLGSSTSVWLRRSLWRLRTSPQVALSIVVLAFVFVFIALFVPDVRIPCGFLAVVFAGLALGVCDRSHWLSIPLGASAAVCALGVTIFGFVSGSPNPPAVVTTPPATVVAKPAQTAPATSSSNDDNSGALAARLQTEQEKEKLEQQENQVNQQAAQNAQTTAENQVQALLAKADKETTDSTNLADDYHFAKSSAKKSQDRDSEIAKAKDVIQLLNKVQSEASQNSVQLATDDQGKLYSDLAVTSWYCGQPYADFLDKLKGLLPQISDPTVQSNVKTNLEGLTKMLKGNVKAW